MKNFNEIRGSEYGDGIMMALSRGKDVDVRTPQRRHQHLYPVEKRNDLSLFVRGPPIASFRGVHSSVLAEAQVANNGQCQSMIQDQKDWQLYCPSLEVVLRS